MIVRNETAVIRRCLDSVKSILDYWVICDTGSTDNTPEIIQETLSGIPGELHRAQWVDFGHNRTQALKLAKDKADYHLLLDADMTLNVTGEFREKPAADAFFLRHKGAIDYWIERLVSDRHDWRYVGPTHEYIWSDTAKSKAKLVELSVVHHEDGGSLAQIFNPPYLPAGRQVAELYSAGRRIGPTRRSFPTSSRVQLRDTAAYNSALRWGAKQIPSLREARVLPNTPR